MLLLTSELRERDVINICDGRHLGFIYDIQIDAECGKICAIFVSENFFGFRGEKNTLKIGWDKISCIGADTILVDIGRDSCDNNCTCDNKKEKRKKGGWLF